MAEPEFQARDILEWEFDYARGTAEQSQDDRTAVLNLYLLLVGGVGSVAVALAQFADQPNIGFPREGYAILFILIASIGVFVVMTLVRLRQAWYDSAVTMNRIKDFYRAKFPELDPVLRWRTETIPPPGKLWAISFNLSLLVMLIDSIAFGAAIHTVAPRVPLGDYAVAGFAAFVFFGWQVLYYFYQLPVNNASN